MRTTNADPAAIREAVIDRYGHAAQIVLNSTGQASCCGPDASCGCSCDPDSTGAATLGYSAEELAALPDSAVFASLGCGNPTALATLASGETVLDLGSGGGIDVLISATRVGPDGFAYGLDMTDEMLDLARRNQQEAGIENVEFLKGQIEEIPLPDASVDVIISNCVINLSTDKDAVLREAFRVLRPGGRFAVSDIVVRGELSEEVRSNLDAWAGCVAGALEERDYLRHLEASGFEDGSIEITHPVAKLEEGSEVVSAFIRATKPAAS